MGKIAENYGLNISRKICSIIDIEVNNSERIEIEQVGENEYVARDNSNLKFNLNFLDCECHYPAHAGIPCRHIIALFRKTGNAFPIHLINSRFNENKNTEKTGEILEDNESLNVTKISEYEELHEIPQISHNNEWMDLLLTEEEDSEFLFEEEEEDREIFNDSNELIDGFVDDEFGFPLRGNYDTIQTVPRRNSISLYQRLMSISKKISAIGSENPIVFEDIEKNLNKIYERYNQRTQFGEVTERRGRKKGRPKLKKFSKNSRIK